MQSTDHQTDLHSGHRHGDRPHSDRRFARIALAIFALPFLALAGYAALLTYSYANISAAQGKIASETAHYITLPPGKSGHAGPARYDHTTITFESSSDEYWIDAGTFTQRLVSPAVGDRVRLWYAHTPLLPNEVVALQQIGPDGKPGAMDSSVGYTDPAGRRNGLLPLPIVLLVVAAGFIVLGLKASEHAEQHPHAHHGIGLGNLGYPHAFHQSGALPQAMVAPRRLERATPRAAAVGRRSGVGR